MQPSNLTKAKAALVLDQPFFAALLLGMPMTEDASVKTLATDGQAIKYNPEFLATLSLPETVFVLAHEVMHCVFQHMYRRGNRNPNRWNIAADYIINDILTRERVGIMPSGCLLNSALVSDGGGTAEGVYNLLPDSDDGKGPGDDGGALDHVSDGGTDPADMAQKESETRVKVIQATNAAKMAGKLSAGLARLVGEMTETRTDWRSILRRFLSERSKVEYSFARPKRRFMADDVNLPGLAGEKLGEVVIAVDCSGSVSDAMLAEFSGEIAAICEDSAPSAVRVVYFDSKVLHVDCFGPDDAIKLNPHGGGGTAFAPIFEYLAAEGIAPAACVVLTDLDAYDFGDAPDCPLLWASTQKRKAPFGEVVLIRD